VKEGGQVHDTSGIDPNDIRVEHYNGKEVEERAV
jgi:hypothetical protein